MGVGNGGVKSPSLLPGGEEKERNVKKLRGNRGFFVKFNYKYSIMNVQ
jgi:hypothetical protein